MSGRKAPTTALRLLLRRSQGQQVGFSPRRIVDVRTIFCVLMLVAVLSGRAWAVDDRSSVNTTIGAGAYIIDMGNASPTFNNTLRGYGAVYDLITNHRVPIYWAIDQGKAKDGIDFTYNARNYRGGPFVTPGELVNPTVLSRIAFWRGQGLPIDGPTTTAMTVPVNDRTTCFPRTVIDTSSAQQGLLTAYFANASIPVSAYLLGTPSTLTCCCDIFMIPHLDPTAASHGALRNFNIACKGPIWGQCHGPSVLESVVATTGPNAGQLSFLSNSGLVPFTAHGNGSPPYNYALPGDRLRTR